MNLSLVSAAAAIGLAGGVHCVAMCASPAALAAPRGATLPFQLGRVLGYTLMGVVAALGAAAFSQVATHAEWVRPFWLMTHVAIMLLGGWMLITGQHPAWLQQALLNLARNLGQRVQRWGGLGWAAAPAGAGAGSPPPILLPARIPRTPSRQRVLGRAILIGMVWALLPCGLLYSALMLAWMSGDIATGAAAMAAFAVVSGVQLWLGQRGLLALLRAGREALAIRLAGLVTLVGAGLLLVWAAAGHSPAGFCLPGF